MCPRSGSWGQECQNHCFLLPGSTAGKKRFQDRFSPKVPVRISIRDLVADGNPYEGMLGLGVGVKILSLILGELFGTGVHLPNSP